MPARGCSSSDGIPPDRPARFMRGGTTLITLTTYVLRFPPGRILCNSLAITSIK